MVKVWRIASLRSHHRWLILVHMHPLETTHPRHPILILTKVHLVLLDHQALHVYCISPITHLMVEHITSIFLFLSFLIDGFEVRLPAMLPLRFKPLQSIITNLSIDSAKLGHSVFNDFLTKVFCYNFNWLSFHHSVYYWSIFINV